MQILEEISSTEQENVVGGPSSTSADSEIAMECTESRNSIDIGVQCNLVVKVCCTVETQTVNDRGLYEVITDENVLDSPTKSLSSVDCSDRVMEEEEYSLSNEEEETDSENEVTQLPVSERKFIVYEEQLDQLLCCCLCPWCEGPVTSASKRTVGSMVGVNLSCLNGHKHSWQSQPCINGRPEGNLLIVAAILFSGNTYEHASGMARLLGLSFIGKSLFYALQEQMLFPIVVQAWKINQASVIDALHQVGSVDLFGDGRCDSPGHSAKYGTYTLLDENTAFSVVQVTEVTSSNAMEAEECRRALDSVLANNVQVRCLTTDRHVTITSEMRKKYPGVQHQYDVWHLAKWIVKKLTLTAKKKKCQDLLPWKQSISNHFWWSVSTWHGNYDELKEKWTSIVHHISNKHSWDNAKLFTHCEHHTLSAAQQRATQWLTPGSDAHIALEEVVFTPKLLKDMMLVTEFHHTGGLEIYHSMILKYCPKRQHFSYKGMIARTQLAVLDHNHSTGRQQSVVNLGAMKGGAKV